MKQLSFFLLVLVLLASCRDDDTSTPPMELEDEDLVAITFAPTDYQFDLHDSLPVMTIPADNPVTNQGVELGRHLFFDPILSSDSTKSCNSCHLIDGAFTDNAPISEGVNGALGQRSSMSLLNIGFAKNGLFWDGRAMTLEEQAKLPIEDIHELNENWDNVELKLQRSSFYPALFREAFGITSRSQITEDLATKAIAQFERSLVVFGGSRFDKDYLNLIPGFKLEPNEIDGFNMFIDNTADDLPDAECFHCHSGILFGSDDYLNNGIDTAATLSDFVDLGRGAVTNNILDNGRFRAPSLRNIALSAPYMHDGRFETLEEVIEHYNSGGHGSPNRNELIVPLNLTDYQKSAILSFLHALTDTTYYENPAFASPF